MNGPPQVVQFPLASGFDEGVDPATLPIGTLRSLVNARWTKDGRLDKRWGTALMSRAILGGGTLSGGARFVIRGDELCVIDGAYLYAYSATAASWVRIGQVPDVGLMSSTLVDPQIGIAATDLAVSAGGLFVHAWVTGDPTTTASGALYVQVVDPSGRSVLLPPTLLSSSGNTRLRVLTIGALAFILTVNGANVDVYTVNLGTFAVSAATHLRTDAGAGSPFDACVIGSNFVIGYATAAATALYAYSTAFVQQATATVQAAVGTVALSIDGASGESLYVAYFVAGTGVRMAVHDASALTQTVAPFTVEGPLVGDLATCAVARYDASSCVLAYCTNGNGAGPGRTTTYRVQNNGTIVTTSLRGTWGARLASRPFLLNGLCYIFAADYPNALPANVVAFPGIHTSLFEIPVSSNGGAGPYVPHRYVGKAEHLIGAATANGCVPNVAFASSTSVYVALAFQSIAPQKSTTWRCGARLVNATCGASLPADMWRSVSIGQEAYVCGGVLSAYDGRTIFDYGFARAPAIGSLLAGGGGSGSMAAGAYGYAFVQEYRSAAGMLHRSPTTVGSVASVPASGSVAETVGGCNVGNKKNIGTGFATSALTTLLALYRTTVGGAPYYRETYEPGSNVVTVNELAQNQTFTDTRADASIDGAGTLLNTRPQVYTAGGILDDHQPTNLLSMVKYRERIVGIGVDKRTLWFSQAYSSNPGVAPGFHARLTLPFTEDLTALAVMDDKLVVFSATSIWIIVGAGPDQAGNGAEPDYSSPIRVQTDVGCTNPRSVLATGDGIFFQSIRGMYVLTRGLELAWMGKRAQDTLASFPKVTSACLVAAQNQVRWTANNAGGTAGVVLVFDTLRKQWSTFRYYDTNAGVSSTPIADATVLSDGTWCFLTAGGSVFKEDPTTYLDGGTAWVAQSGEIASVSASGTLGFQRVRRAFLLGDRLTDCNLTLAFDVDDKGTYPQSHTWVSDDLANLHARANVGMRVGVQNGMNPRCRAFSLKWSDAAPTGVGAVVGTGQGINLSVLGMEIVPKTGMERRAARARA